MSCSRVSLTPFDDEPDKRIADEVRIRFDYRDQRKKKDLEKLTQLSREIRDGYKGEAEVSEERDAEIMAMLARIVENRRRLGMGSKKDREIYELYRSRVVVPSNAGKSKASGQGQTANRGMNVRTPAATRRSTRTARQNRTRGQHSASAGAARRESEVSATSHTRQSQHKALTRIKAARATLRRHNACERDRTSICSRQKTTRGHVAATDERN